MMKATAVSHQGLFKPRAASCRPKKLCSRSEHNEGGGTQHLSVQTAATEHGDDLHCFRRRAPCRYGGSGGTGPHGYVRL